MKKVKSCAKSVLIIICACFTFLNLTNLTNATTKTVVPEEYFRMEEKILDSQGYCNYIQYVSDYVDFIQRGYGYCTHNLTEFVARYDCDPYGRKTWCDFEGKSRSGTKYLNQRITIQF